MTNEDKIKVVCVLKRGGSYQQASVKVLKDMVSQHLTIPHEFICLTDMVVAGATPLLGNYYKWWSKIEAFRITGAVIYFDLDTCIFQSIDSIAKNLLNAKSKNINILYMLHTFRNTFRNTGDWSSSFMAWSGNFKWLYNEFDENNDPKKYLWEQKYIIDKLKGRNTPVLSIQGIVDGRITGYKHYTMSDEEIKKMDVAIACFHNKIVREKGEKR